MGLGGLLPWGGSNGGGRIPTPEEQKQRIRDLMNQEPVPLDKLRALALSRGGGFVDHDLRQQVWPKLLGVDRFALEPYRPYVRRGQWSEQIGRDVDRSLWHFALGNAKKRKRGLRRRLLEDMVNAMMAKHPDLHYFQGYHDILSILVLVLTESEDLCFAVAERITLAFLGDCMARPDFHSLTALLELLFPLVKAFDAGAARVLEEAGVHAFVCLPWVITWWAHDSTDLGRCARMFDAFLAAPPVFPLYVAAAMIARAGPELQALEERDFASVHTFIARLASRRELPVEELIVEAHAMLRRKPPTSLVRASRSRSLALAEMVRHGEIHALREPPDWQRRRTAPSDDWLRKHHRKEAKAGKAPRPVPAFGPEEQEWAAMGDGKAGASGTILVVAVGAVGLAAALAWQWSGVTG